MTAEHRRLKDASLVDHELLERFRNGDGTAFDALYARYNARITSYAARLLGRREEGEEVSTETFVKVVEGRYRPTGSFRSFLFTVAHRLCLDRLRWRERRARLLRLFGQTEPPKAPDLEELATTSERRARLYHALAGLPTAHQAVVLLTYVEGMRSPEAAQILGWTDQQVRSKLTYARRLLRDALEGVDDG